jgi:extradiol dioxygenase family protein
VDGGDPKEVAPRYETPKGTVVKAERWFALGQALAERQIPGARLEPATPRFSGAGNEQGSGNKNPANPPE